MKRSGVVGKSHNLDSDAEPATIPPQTIDHERAAYTE